MSLEDNVRATTEKLIFEKKWLSYEHISPLLEEQSENFIDQFTQIIRDAVILGETSQQAVRKVIGYKDKSGVKHEGIGYIGDRKSATLLVNTSIKYILQTRYIGENIINPSLTTYKKNADMICGVQWVATLDGRTCYYCAVLDRKMWDLQGNPVGSNVYKFPNIMAHAGCRCVHVPVLKSFRPSEFGGDYVDSGTRASMNGQVPSSWDYTTWFKHQDTEFQKNYLGSERYDLWINKRIFFHQLIRINGTLRTIEELNEIASKQNL